MARRPASTLACSIAQKQWGEERRPAGNLLALTRSWRCSVVLSRVQETCSVQTSTKIVEKDVEKLTANKRKKVSRPVARLEMVCKISVRFWCQGRTDGKVKRLWLFNARESMVDLWGGRRTNHKKKKMTNKIGGEQLRSGKCTFTWKCSSRPTLALCSMDIHLHEIRRLEGCPGCCREVMPEKYIVLQRGARFTSL